MAFAVSFGGASAAAATLVGAGAGEAWVPLPGVCAQTALPVRAIKLSSIPRHLRRGIVNLTLPPSTGFFRPNRITRGSFPRCFAPVNKPPEYVALHRQLSFAVTTARSEIPGYIAATSPKDQCSLVGAQHLSRPCRDAAPLLGGTKPSSSVLSCL